MIDFEKGNGLVPAIIQDTKTRQVLMLGYMNEDAYHKTLEIKKVTFFSRSKERLWTKGEESGNYLELIDIKADCDSDSLLVRAIPKGPTCHTGTDTCWGESNIADYSFLGTLEATINNRLDGNSDKSYVKSLVDSGINKVAQKVGEEAVELVIEAMRKEDALFKEEASDLLFHYLVLLRAKGFSLSDIIAVLESRHKA